MNISTPRRLFCNNHENKYMYYISILPRQQHREEHKWRTSTSKLFCDIILIQFFTDSWFILKKYLFLWGHSRRCMSCPSLKLFWLLGQIRSWWLFVTCIWMSLKIFFMGVHLKILYGINFFFIDQWILSYWIKMSTPMQLTVSFQVCMESGLNSMLIAQMITTLF